MRVPGEDHCLDVLSCYQHVWRSKDTLTANKESRRLFLAQLKTSIKGLPLRNTLLILGDFNMSLRTDMRHVGPCTIQSCRLGHRGSRAYSACLKIIILLRPTPGETMHLFEARSREVRENNVNRSGSFWLQGGETAVGISHWWVRCNTAGVSPPRPQSPTISKKWKIVIGTDRKR